MELVPVTLIDFYVSLFGLKEEVELGKIKGIIKNNFLKKKFYDAFVFLDAFDLAKEPEIQNEMIPILAVTKEINGKLVARLLRGLPETIQVGIVRGVFRTPGKESIKKATDIIESLKMPIQLFPEVHETLRYR